MVRTLVTIVTDLVAWRYLGYQPSCSNVPSLSFVISFPFTTNVRYLAGSTLVRGFWYENCLVSAFKPVPLFFLSWKSYEVNFRKSLLLLRCRHSPNVVFERAVVAHVLLYILTACYAACFSAVLQHHEGKEIAGSFNDELKRVTGYFEVSIFTLLSYDLFSFTVSPQPRCSCEKSLWTTHQQFTPKFKITAQFLCIYRASIICKTVESESFSRNIIAKIAYGCVLLCCALRCFRV